jgi:hypothetical protein
MQTLILDPTLTLKKRRRGKSYTRRLVRRRGLRILAGFRVASTLNPAAPTFVPTPRLLTGYRKYGRIEVKRAMKKIPLDSEGNRKDVGLSIGPRRGTRVPKEVLSAYSKVKYQKRRESPPLLGPVASARERLDIERDFISRDMDLPGWEPRELVKVPVNVIALQEELSEESKVHPGGEHSLDTVKRPGKRRPKNPRVRMTSYDDDLLMGLS